MSVFINDVPDILNHTVCNSRPRSCCPCRDEPRRQQQEWQSAVWEPVLHQKNLFSNMLNFSTAYLNIFFFHPSSLVLGSASLPPVAALGMSDLSPRRGAVSGQTAHQGEWQVLGQEFKGGKKNPPRFQARRWWVAHCSFNAGIFQLAFLFFYCLPGQMMQEVPGSNQGGALK